jgi:hypothetical protein
VLSSENKYKSDDETQSSDAVSAAVQVQARMLMSFRPASMLMWIRG